MTEPSAIRPSTRSGPVHPAFPTRRAIVGGAAVAGVAWALTYRPTPDRPWTQLTGKAPWSPRDGTALLVHNDSLWVFGGSASNQILDVGDGWSSINGIDWRKEVDRAAWTPSGQSMSVTFAGRLWRMGGFVVQESQVLPIGEIWSSADGRTWTLATAAPAWRPRGGGALVVHNGRLWLLGGTRHPRNEGDQPALGDVWSTENGVDWTEVAANAPWKPRAFHSVIVHNGRLWVIGGGHWGKNPMFYRDVWSSLDGIKWTEHSSKGAWPGRIWATAASYKGLLWIMGGSIGPRGGSTNDTWYSNDGRDWYPYLAAKPWPPPRAAHSSIVFNDQLLVLAGSDGDYFNDVWGLKIERDEVFPGSSLTRAQKWLYMTFKP